jgi:hypothetical protein
MHRRETTPVRIKPRVESKRSSHTWEPSRAYASTCTRWHHRASAPNLTICEWRMIHLHSFWMNQWMVIGLMSDRRFRTCLRADTTVPALQKPDHNMQMKDNSFFIRSEWTMSQWSEVSGTLEVYCQLSSQSSVSVREAKKPRLRRHLHSLFVTRSDTSWDMTHDTWDEV